MSVFCERCGNRLDETVKFCNSCGAEVVILNPSKPLEAGTTSSSGPAGILPPTVLSRESSPPAGRAMPPTILSAGSGSESAGRWIPPTILAAGTVNESSQIEPSIRGKVSEQSVSQRPSTELSASSSFPGQPVNNFSPSVMPVTEIANPLPPSVTPLTEVSKSFPSSEVYVETRSKKINSLLWIIPLAGIVCIIFIALLAGLYWFFIRPGMVVQDYLRKGNDAFSEGRYEEAIEYYDKVLTIQPSHSEALSKKSEAEKEIWEEDEEASIEELVKSGDDFYEEGNYEEAIECYNAVLEIDSGHTYAKSRIEEAEKKLEEASEDTFPEDSVAEVVRYSLQNSTVSSSDSREEVKPSEKYATDLAVDGKSNTAWNAEGSEGKWIKIFFPETVSLVRAGIIPGYDKIVNDEYGDRWTNNNRIKKGTLVFSNGTKKTVTFDIDKREMQYVELDPPVSTFFLKLEIDEVFRGEKFNDTCISEIEVYVLK